MNDLNRMIEISIELEEIKKRTFREYHDAMVLGKSNVPSNEVHRAIDVAFGAVRTAIGVARRDAEYAAGYSTRPQRAA